MCLSLTYTPSPLSSGTGWRGRSGFWTATAASSTPTAWGMGKTEVGVQFIREHTQDLGQHVLVISPAQLRDRLWQQRLSEGEPAGDGGCPTSS